MPRTAGRSSLDARTSDEGQREPRAQAEAQAQARGQALPQPRSLLAIAPAGELGRG